MEEKEQPNYYAIIPAEVRYNEDLAPNEKLLYGEITALCNKTGQCFATNSYFAELYKVEVETISRWISHLIKNGFITSNIDKANGNVRYIQLNQYLLTKKSIPIDKKINRGIDKKINNNNTSNNNTINNIEIKRFTPPTLEEVANYCKERGNDVDPERFIDFYESKGWFIGKNKVKNWRACIRTWEKREEPIKYNIHNRSISNFSTRRNYTIKEMKEINKITPIEELEL